VFINERFENVGSFIKGDLPPGRYRVFVQIAKRLSRVHEAVIEPDKETVLQIDPDYDAALQTSGAHIGFSFADDAARKKHESLYAARFADELGASSIAVVGTESIQARPSLVGSVVGIHSGKDLRRASLALEPMPTVERIRALAAFLAGDEPAEGLEVELGEALHVEGEAAGAHGPGWMLGTGIGGLVLGVAGGALAAKFVVDARDTGDELHRVCAVSCTSEQALGLQSKQKTANRNAIISGAAGVALAATGVTLIVIWRMKKTSSNPIAIGPTRDGVYASFTWSF
jgi:hypothetical protein